MKKTLKLIVLAFLLSMFSLVKADDNTVNDLKNQGYDIIEATYNEIIVKKDNNYGIFDTDGKLLVPVIYDNAQLFKEQKNRYPDLYVVTKGKLKGAYLKYGRPVNSINVVPVNYDKIEEYVIQDSNYFIIVSKKNKKGLYEIINEGNRTSEWSPMYDDIQVLTNGNIAVKLDKKWGLYKFSKQLVPMRYDEIEVTGKYGSAAIAKRNNKKGLYYNGRGMLSCVYDNISYNSYNNNDIETFIVKQDNKYGVFGYDYMYNDEEYVNIKNIVPINFDEIKVINRGFITKKNGKYGLYHITSGKMLDTEYDMIYSPNSRKVICEKNGQTKTFDMEEITSIKEKIEQAVVKTIFFPIFMLFEGLP